MIEIKNENYRPEYYVELKSPKFLFNQCEVCGKSIKAPEQFCKMHKKEEAHE